MPAPLIPPGVGIFDNPAYLILINAEWWSHVSGQITRLLYPDAWDGTDSQIDDAIQSIYKLIDVGIPHSFTIFGDSTPVTGENPDASAVNLGVKFQVGITGEIVGLRFWKGVDNTGTHTGYLFEGDGTPLGSLTFADETASGWQYGYFDPPIPVVPFVMYRASYFAPNGHYASDAFSFGTDVVNVVMRALQSDTVGGNGIYSYGAAGTVPDDSYNSTNYWIDVLFRPKGN